MACSTSLLDEIATAPRVEHRVAVIVAHPDDETIGLGSRLAAFAHLVLVQLTDGSPRCLDDARRAGFDNRESYAAARAREVDASLASLGVGARRVACGHCDQESIDAIDAIVERLEVELAEVDAVITHPYEHGHPDHDTAALAVALACRRLAAQQRRAPARFEFASYHACNGAPRYGAFWTDPSRPERCIAVDDTERDAKSAALACHATQAETLALLPLSPERIRAAPDYDFAATAPPGDALYDRYGWAMTSDRWRAAAARAWAARAHDNEPEQWRQTAAPADAR